MKFNSGISAIILAAGMSRRMGTPKQLLKVGETTLLGRVVENVRRSRADEVVLVLGHAADAIRQHLSTDGIKVVINPNYSEGMGSSLRAGLSALKPDCAGALIVLADQPFVQPCTLDQLIEYHHQHKPQILIPMYKGFRGNPVLLDRSVFPELMQLTGDIGCRAIFGSHLEGIHKLPVEDAGILLDIDNSDDLEKLQAANIDEMRTDAVFQLADVEDRGRPTGADVSVSKPELLIVGRDAVAKALASFGRSLHFSVTVVDPLMQIDKVPEANRVLRVLDFSRLPQSNKRFVVVASRGQFDEEAVEQALLCNAAYVGLLANKKRAQEILRSLKFKGLPKETLEQLRAPAGIDIGAKSPEEIALSIMAEIVASWNEVAARNSASFPN